jgi:hypothetical protein
LVDHDLCEFELTDELVATPCVARACAIWKVPPAARAADLWLPAQLDQRQRFQQLFFAERMTFDGTAERGNRGNRCCVIKLTL